LFHLGTSSVVAGIGLFHSNMSYENRAPLLMTVECAKMGKMPQGASIVDDSSVIVRLNECAARNVVTTSCLPVMDC
jgi:hypothetical protein